ncbi:MAG: diguanylate cyclase [Syntrophobacter sp.]
MCIAGKHEDNPNVEWLSEIIIEELKNLSEDRQKVTSSRLSEALSIRSEIVDLLKIRNAVAEFMRIQHAICSEIDRFLMDERHKIDLMETPVGPDHPIHLEYVNALKESLFSRLNAIKDFMSEERSFLEHFVHQLSTQLNDVEDRCFNLCADSEQMHATDRKFTDSIESQVNDMVKTTCSENSYAILKDQILSRLNKIKAALDEKRREDQARQQSSAMQIEELKTNLKKMKKQIDISIKREKSLERDLSTDSLTGVANRRAYKVRLEQELKKFKRYKHEFSMIMFDMDYFKTVNDTYGHIVGDMCIRQVVSRIRQVLRETDFMARFGGDEFIIILPETNKEVAIGVANRISSCISNARFVYRNQQISLSISIGLSQILESDADPETLFCRVDEALYTAKKQGRGLVFCL